MNKLELFYFFIGCFGVLYGVSVFVPDRVIVVLSAIAGIIAGVLALILVLE